ncbi:MAG: glycyl-radical enzyme activating protein [Acidobacteria bacterium]|nr:glycyl-radical enzyme activating protein [Acidobacteriota bacterium]
MTGRIFDIQRFCIDDGPGIRTTVFLKGCPLHCKWCHNPESISPAPHLSFLQEKCIGCDACIDVCPKGALARTSSGKAILGRQYCDACGACAGVCDTKALEMVGRDAAVEEVMAVVLRDREYYQASTGGMTLSGGEPLYQPAFAKALLVAAKAEGLHTVVETSGFAEWAVLESILPLVDLFLYDYKETDAHLHQAFTGQSNELILENLRKLHAAGARILLRCPMIPEFNARKEHLDGIARTAASLPRLAGVELLPYHRLGRAKLQRLGFLARMPESVKPPDEHTVRGWNDYLTRQGVNLR